MLHISNRYLDLEPVVANLAEDAAARRPAPPARRLRGGRGGQPDPTLGGPGPAAEALGELATDERWTAGGSSPDPAVGIWTDDFHNVLSVFKWR